MLSRRPEVEIRTFKGLFQSLFVKPSTGIIMYLESYLLRRKGCWPELMVLKKHWPTDQVSFC